MSKPGIFQELATKGHDIEFTIVNRRGTSFGFVELKKDKAKFRRNLSSPRIPPKRRCPSLRLS